MFAIFFLFDCDTLLFPGKLFANLFCQSPMSDVVCPCRVSYWQHMATYLLYFVMLLNVFITTFGISTGASHHDATPTPTSPLVSSEAPSQCKCRGEARWRWTCDAGRLQRDETAATGSPIGDNVLFYFWTAERHGCCWSRSVIRKVVDVDVCMCVCCTCNALCVTRVTLQWIRDAGECNRLLWSIHTEGALE